MSGKRPATIKRKPASRPTPPRAKFTSLPNELVTQIAMLCDVHSAKSLARVCRAFTEPAMSRIWDHIDFTLNDKLYQPVLRTNKRVREAEDRYEVALIGKARVIKGNASKQKLGKVTKVTLLPRAGVAQIMVDILEGASLTVREMRIGGRLTDHRGDAWRPNDHDMLDLRLCRLLDRQVSFPALTSVHLADQSIRFSGFLPLLIALAPNITSLNLDLSQDLSQAQNIFPSFEKPTKIRDARITCYWGHDVAESSDGMALLALIKRSTQLQRLSFLYNDCTTAVHNRACEILRGLDKLENLHWLSSIADFPPLPNDGGSSFAGLRRIVFHGSNWMDVVRSSNRANVHNRSPCLRFINVLDSFVDHADLHIFSRLDDIERRGDLTGYVRSFRHGGAELLHARMLLNHTWDEDTDVIDGVTVPRELRGAIWHDAREETLRKQTFPDRPSATWRNFTDYEGTMVPLSVIQRMKEVEGAVGAWEGRGIEVGAAAWKVLTDWVEAQT